MTFFSEMACAFNFVLLDVLRLRGHLGPILNFKLCFIGFLDPRFDFKLCSLGLLMCFMGSFQLALRSHCLYYNILYYFITLYFLHDIT